MSNLTMSTSEQLTEDFLKKHACWSQINRGAGVLLIFKNGIYFLLSKPKYWETDRNSTIIKFGGIGGSIEKNEKPIECLKRELDEEVKISFEQIKFAYPSTTLLIKDDMPIQRINMTESDIPSPIYVLELILPLRKDRAQTGKTYSSLQLFVYLAKVKNSFTPKISENEDITAIMHVNQNILDRLLKGEIEVNKKETLQGIKIFWNENLSKDIPLNFKLYPRFSPIGLLKANLHFKDLEKYFK
ncbi:NUDIX domain-containing protein [Cellulosilyticum sp. I15G10I2]|uniref:NUDIX domain-containing protein n=1 Tax=Cellulosilyticum sp. I15G10I2 TaxID=1892843 RepID=UPI00085BE4CD|nr:NUDIX domain-containing protein [Cellulosilyticum sp. I15G10I2]